MLIDLHVPAPADGRIDDYLRRAAKRGLDGIALLGDDAFALLPPERDVEGVRLFSGARVATDRGLWLVFVPSPGTLPGLEELFGPREDGVFSVRDVLVRTEALGGAAVAARPYDRTIDHPGGDILYTLPHVAAVEAVTPHEAPALSLPAVEAAETLGLPCVGGSAARSAEAVGTAATLFAHALADEADLADALRSGRCWPVDFSGTRTPGRGPQPRPAAPAGADAEPERRRRRRRR